MACTHPKIEDGKCPDCGYCAHAVVYCGLCALCGNTVDQSSEENDTNDHIDMTHNSSGITVSLEEAERIQNKEDARLLKAKKLSLIVDLDQTILHAAWEPHIANWVDEHKPRGDKRAQDMSTFSLDGSMSKYTIKLRPGLMKFLREMSQLYEMHIYTMGTRAYADAVAAVIDPTHELFQDRILTRDENGSMTKKRLERLFPSNQQKVVVLDDRADVWDYSPNLIQIKPYEYFAGIGDINAPPNAQPNKIIPIIDNVNTPTTGSSPNVNNDTIEDGEQSSNQEAKQEDDVDNNSSNQKQPAETSVENSDDVHQDSDSSNTISSNDKSAEDNSEHTESNNKNAESSSSNTTSNDDKDTNNSDNTTSTSEESSNENNNSSSTPNSTELIPKDDATMDSPATDETIKPPPNIQPVGLTFKPKQNDPDCILNVISKALTDIHSEYYRKVDEGDAEPDVATILPELKSRVLKNVTLVFSGVIPLHIEPHNASIWKMADSFGAQCMEELTGKVTHLVAANAGTSKVSTARKHSQIKIVSPAWLMDSVWNWKKLDEDDYYIPLPREGSTASEVENPEETPLEYDDGSNFVANFENWSDSEVDSALDDDDEEDDDDEDNDEASERPSSSSAGPSSKNKQTKSNGKTKVTLQNVSPGLDTFGESSDNNSDGDGDGDNLEGDVDAASGNLDDGDNKLDDGDDDDYDDFGMDAILDDLDDDGDSEMSESDFVYSENANSRTEDGYESSSSTGSRKRDRSDEDDDDDDHPRKR